MQTDLFDFELPDDRIALPPVAPRDAARLLVVAADGKLERPRRARPAGAAAAGRCARPQRHARHSGGARGRARARRCERAASPSTCTSGSTSSRWRAFARPAKRLAAGDRVRFGHDGRVCLLGALEATVAAKGEARRGRARLRARTAPDLDEAIAAARRHAAAALHRGQAAAAAARTPSDYQTDLCRREGAVAAPTAGLHFTPELLAALDARGISRHFVTLHVGAGTFLPVKAEDTAEHRMHAEWGEIAAGDGGGAQRGARRAAAASSPSAPRRCGCWRAPPAHDGTIRPFAGETDIFITPGYRFRAVDVLMTNFHLPRSTLFMLVSALQRARRDAARLRARHRQPATASIPTATPACCIPRRPSP